MSIKMMKNKDLLITLEIIMQYKKAYIPYSELFADLVTYLTVHLLCCRVLSHHIRSYQHNKYIQLTGFKELRKPKEKQKINICKMKNINNIRKYLYK